MNKIFPHIFKTVHYNLNSDPQTTNNCEGYSFSELFGNDPDVQTNTNILN